MARLDDIYESKWMRASDLRGKAVTYTIARVEAGMVGQGDDAKKQLIATFEEHDKPLGLNKTNAGAIGDVYGDETDDWYGRKVVLFPTQVTYNNQMVDAIRVDKRQTLAILQGELKALKASQSRPQPAASATRPGTRPATKGDLAEAEAEIIGDDGDPMDQIPF